MENEKAKKDNTASENKDGIQPDSETLHTTDPQKHMEGPISSLMHKTGEGFKTDKSQKQADQEKEENM
jgi:hypothetical protein